MNLILCSKDCIHQRDGFCRLEGRAAPTGSVVDGCCYYRAQKTPQPKTSRRRNS